MRLEKTWTTEAGLTAAVVVQAHGSRCGYVGVPKGHAAAGKSYDELDIDVHGGLTYDGSNESYPAPSDGLWWFGYDCAHWGDARDPELMTPDYKELYDKGLFTSSLDEFGVVRSLEFCVEQCESLPNNSRTYHEKSNCNHPRRLHLGWLFS